METLIHIAYLISAVLFIFGLKLLSSPKTARRGNFFAALAMLVAIVVTLLDKQILDYTLIIVGVIVGGAIGAIAARRVQMTAMPQMVSLFNGLGGGASALVATATFLSLSQAPAFDVGATMVLSLLIGAVTFTGSLIAFGKLQGVVRSAPIAFPFQQMVNSALLALVLVLGTLFVLEPNLTTIQVLLAIAVLSAALGVLLVIPIGGADMPVVVSLLNSYSGLAAAMTGFVLRNNMLIISGALVGASGLILTNIMCKAMNRKLTNVLFGKVGVDEKGEVAAGGQQHVVAYTCEDALVMLESAGSAIIVPGYGLAVAQAQHAIAELADLLDKRGVRVSYAIHPVAGRMPGHMNVLLAEANVAYDHLFELDAINDDFKNTDVALVVGANDVVNPAARYKQSSPLFGMPILNVDEAKSVIVLKRSLRPGFAGEENELFYSSKTMMVFGDAKRTLTQLVNLLRDEA